MSAHREPMGVRMSAPMGTPEAPAKPEAPRCASEGLPRRSRRQASPGSPT